MSDVARHAPSIAPLISLLPIFIAAVVQRARRRIVDLLLAAGAIEANHAIALEPRSRIEQRMISRMESSGAIKPAGAGYYLDEAANAACRAARMKRIPLLIILALVAVGLAVGIALIVRPIERTPELNHALGWA